MTSLKKPLLAVVALMTALLAGLLLAGPAGAYPAGVAATLTVGNATCGQPVSFSGSHYRPGATVKIKVDGKVEDTVVADSSGNISGSFTLSCPNGAGAVTVKASGGGDVDALTVQAGGGNGGGGGNNGGGGLSSTGVAVVGIGAIGVVLLLGGGLLLFAGKRRRVTA